MENFLRGRLLSCSSSVLHIFVRLHFWSLCLVWSYWSFPNCRLFCPYLVVLAAFALLQSQSLTPAKAIPLVGLVFAQVAFLPQGSFVRNSSGLTSATAKLAGKWKASSLLIVLSHVTAQITLLFPGVCCTHPRTAFQLSKTAIDPHCRIICSCLRAVYLFRACKCCPEEFDSSEKWISVAGAEGNTASLNSACRLGCSLWVPTSAEEYIQPELLLLASVVAGTCWAQDCEAVVTLSNWGGCGKQGLIHRL